MIKKFGGRWLLSAVATVSPLPNDIIKVTAMLNLSVVTVFLG